MFISSPGKKNGKPITFSPQKKKTEKENNDNKCILFSVISYNCY